jgi:hypothetical protein
MNHFRPKHAAKLAVQVLLSKKCSCIESDICLFISSTTLQTNRLFTFIIYLFVLCFTILLASHIMLYSPVTERNVNYKLNGLYNRC